MEPEEVEFAYGLPTVRLEMDYEDISKLRNGGFSKTRVAAYARLEGHSFSVDVSMAGNTTQSALKNSFRLIFPTAYNGRHSYRLNALNKDPSALRAYLSFEVYRKMGFPVPELKYVALIINDEYLGVYLFHENIDEEYFNSRGIDVTRIFKAETFGTSPASLLSSTGVSNSFSSDLGSKSFEDLEEFVGLIHQPLSKKNTQELEKRANVEMILRYMAIAAFLNHTDGITNNLVFFASAEDPRFSLAPWDLDNTFKRIPLLPKDGTLFEKNGMMNRFYNDPGYRKRLDEINVELYSELTADYLCDYLDDAVATIARAHKADPVLGANPVPLTEMAAKLKSRFEEQATLARPLLGP